MDDVRLYNYAMDATEIMLLFRTNAAWAWAPNPSSGTQNVPILPNLQWKPGDFVPPGKHNVYLSTVANSTVPVSAAQDPNNYTPLKPLDLDTEYFWAVGETNATPIVPPDDRRPFDWTFKTVDNRLVDDMERYVDTNNIFDYWSDGVGVDEYCSGHNGTGSWIEAAASPVHNGIRSMKLTYDLDGSMTLPGGAQPECNGERIAAKYAETKADIVDLPIDANWAASKAKALVLWFSGDPGNSLEELWVELTDGGDVVDSVKYGPPYLGEDVTDIQDANWTEWNIALSEFSIDLTDVKSIAIIIGNKQTPTTGGQGTVHFDDIYLYARRCVLDKRTAVFAQCDYADDDCIVNLEEVEVMSGEWLDKDAPAVAWGGWTANGDINEGDMLVGSATSADPLYTVTGSGSDIFGNNDNFHYLYKPLTGDGRLTARVVSVSGGTNNWRKAGVMIREDLDPNSAEAMICMSQGGAGGFGGGHGDAFQWRATKGASSGSSHVLGDSRTIIEPTCLTLVRNGDSFSGYVYYDGEWLKEGNVVTIPMPETVYIGLAVTSHNIAESTTVEFDNVCPEFTLPHNLVEDDVINFEDYAFLMMHFLEEQPFPRND